MDEFNQSNVNEITSEMLEDLSIIADEKGLTVSIGDNPRVGSDNVSITVQFKLKDTEKIAKRVNDQLRQLDIPETAVYGAEFTSQRDTFRIVEANFGRRKYPISATRIRDDRSFKFTESQIRTYL